jgi:predicted DNA-binding protein (MmcQ/YjbR family)
MDSESVRSFCLSLPHVTEKVQWGNDLVFKIGGKMFAVVVLDEASPNRFSFKCTPEKFAELIERENIVPAPYAARYYGVALQSWNALGASELKNLIMDSYEMVLTGLPKKVQAALDQHQPKKRIVAKNRGGN